MDARYETRAHSKKSLSNSPALSDVGIGLTEQVGEGTQTYLHDGRGRSLEEAILWHGGEAEQSKESFRTPSESDRDKLLDFLRSL